jgi:Ca2+-binding EF-hand superfamily protein
LVGVVVLATPARPAEGAEDFLLLADKGPVVLRLHLLVDGRPAAEVRARYFDRLFADLDRDGDGFLTRAEAARAPSVAFLQSFLNGGAAADAQDNVAPLEQLDAGRRGRVSRHEFEAYYRRAGLDRVRLVVAPADHTADVLTDVLFGLLDRDGDGKLSRAELKQAAGSLRAADFNDDEWITPDELLLVRKTDAPRPQAEMPVLLARDPGAGAEAWAKAVRKRYGQFDEAGAAALWRRPPDWVLRVRLATSRTARPAEENPRRAEVVTPARRTVPPEKDARGNPSGDLRLSVGNLELEVQAAEGPETSVPSLHQFIRQQFQAADADGKGFLTRKQAEESDLLAGLFVLADRDGDGQLAEQELHSFLDLHAFGAVSFTTVTLADRSPGLFDLLDADGDGRLSLRELATARDRLGVYDRDGDGLLGRHELPRRLQLRLVQGKPGRRPPAAARPAQKPAAARGPAWFRKADRNGDGYLSRREWLGPEEWFRRLDADGDGLISPEEAEALGGPAQADKSGP